MAGLATHSLGPPDGHGHYEVQRPGLAGGRHLPWAARGLLRPQPRLGLAIRGLLFNNVISYKVGIFNGVQTIAGKSTATPSGLVTRPTNVAVNFPAYTGVNPGDSPSYDGYVRINFLGYEPDYSLLGIAYNGQAYFAVGGEELTSNRGRLPLPRVEFPAPPTRATSWTCTWTCPSATCLANSWSKPVGCGPSIPEMGCPSLSDSLGKTSSTTRATASTAVFGVRLGHLPVLRVRRLHVQPERVAGPVDVLRCSGAQLGGFQHRVAWETCRRTTPA